MAHWIQINTGYLQQLITRAALKEWIFILVFWAIDVPLPVNYVSNEYFYGLVTFGDLFARLSSEDHTHCHCLGSPPFMQTGIFLLGQEDVQISSMAGQRVKSPLWSHVGLFTFKKANIWVFVVQSSLVLMRMDFICLVAFWSQPSLLRYDISIRHSLLARECFVYVVTQLPRK